MKDNKNNVNHQKALMETTQLFFPNHFRRLLSECPPSVRNLHSTDLDNEQRPAKDDPLKEENIVGNSGGNPLLDPMFEIDYEASESGSNNSNIKEALGHLQRSSYASIIENNGKEFMA